MMSLSPEKIAWISCVGEKGGAETLMIECLRELDRSRFTPEVIQLRPGPLTALLESIGVRVHVLEKHRVREFHKVASTIASIRSLVRSRGIRLLHSNGFRAHLYGGAAAALAGIAEVWTTHTVEQDGPSTRAILSIPTDHVLANCPRTRDYFLHQGKPTSLVWPGVNAKMLEALATQAPRELLSKAHGIPANRRWITVGARLQRFKGQDQFLRALGAVIHQGGARDIHGIVVGGSLFGQETDYQRELRELARELGIQDQVTFTGFVPDAHLAGLLAASTLLVHPAMEEDFGLTVAEAQALGIPVVAYAAVGPAEIIRHGQTGWLVPVGDVPGLGTALREALGAGEGLAKMGRQGRQRTLGEFGADHHARLTEAIYRQALDRLRPVEGDRT
jgi:glycosyltransferase involved in cell wall biosynthesis